MRRIGRIELSNLLLHNACEILFVRRRPNRAKSRPATRKMLCSNSMELLNSENGIRSLNFHFPKGPKQIDESYHNVVVTWDIFMQDYRNVSMDECFLIKSIPDDDTFWNYYNEVLLKMSPTEKLQFMDS